MKWKFTSAFLVFVCLLSFHVRQLSGENGPIQIDGHGKGFFSIQAAINASSEGDRILVGRGRYLENITVDVKGVTLKSLEKHGAQLVGNVGSPTIRIMEDDIIFDGFLVSCSEGAMLAIDDKRGIVIRNCIFNGKGLQGRDVIGVKIRLSQAELKDNIITNITGTGIWVEEPKGKLIFLRNEISTNYIGVNFTLTDREAVVEFRENVFHSNYCHLTLNNPVLLNLAVFVKENRIVEHFHLLLDEINQKWKLVPCHDCPHHS